MKTRLIITTAIAMMIGVGTAKAEKLLGQAYLKLEAGASSAKAIVRLESPKTGRQWGDIKAVLAKNEAPLLSNTNANYTVKIIDLGFEQTLTNAVTVAAGGASKAVIPNGSGIARDVEITVTADTNAKNEHFWSFYVYAE